MAGLQSSRRFVGQRDSSDPMVSSEETRLEGRPGVGVGADASSRSRSATSSALAEQELRDAIASYQRSSGRMFPTWSEVLEVLQSLGYRKAGEEAVAAETPVG